MLRTKFNRTLLLGTLASLCVWSCGSDSKKEKLEAAALSEGCSLNSDCNNPLVCTFERCHQACEKDRDCPLPQRCIKGDDGRVCQLDDDTKCDRDRDCDGDQVCGVDGECRDQCKKNSDCADDQVCANSGECASEDPNRDLIDEDGNILPSGGSNGTGGSAGSGGSGGSTSGSGGSGGKTTSSSSSGGTSGNGGTGGETSSGGATSSGGMGGTEASGGTGGSGGSETGGTGGSETGGTGGSGGCPSGYGDCDDNPDDCETPLTLITSCGSCETTCDASHGDVRCDAETLECVLGSSGCSEGFDDCDGDVSTGCEAELAVDPNNCGKCDHSCGRGTCANSQCGVGVVMDPPGNESYSYVNGYLVGDEIFSSSSYQGWTLRSVSLPLGTDVSEGTIIQHYDSGGTSVVNNSVVFDNTYAYYALQANPSSVLRKAKDGSGSTSEAFQSPYYPRAMALSATAFYFFAQAASPNNPYAIYTVPKSGGTPTVITGLGGRAANVYDFKISATRIYWVEYVSPSYRVFAAPIGGGTPVELDSDVGGQYARLAVDSTHVYWNSYFASGKIRRAAHNSDTAEDVAVGVTSPREGMALDDNYVYFWNASGGYHVYRAPKSGGDAEQITVVTSIPYFLDLFAVDSASVYGVGTYGEILSVPNAP